MRPPRTAPDLPAAFFGAVFLVGSGLYIVGRAAGLDLGNVMRLAMPAGLLVLGAVLFLTAVRREGS